MREGERRREKAGEGGRRREKAGEGGRYGEITRLIGHASLGAVLVCSDAVVEQVGAQPLSRVGQIAVGGDGARGGCEIVLAVAVVVAPIDWARAAQQVARGPLPRLVAPARHPVDTHPVVGARAVVVLQKDVIRAMHAAGRGKSREIMGAQGVRRPWKDAR